ncbi:Tex family protein [Proteinivorax tanatarense]|uniref:Tex family protein n=1 Tax=Proteinivorax tanatarense TaxID=1260629 RepID=A0AAU7VKW2_9FIRM
MEEIISIVVGQTGLSKKSVKETIALIDDGNTVPFIARYRKEMTGGLSEEEIRKIAEVTEYQRNLHERKEEVHRLITEQGKMTEQLKEAIYASTKLQQLEDIYRPYRPKRNTRASKAKDLGLEPLADSLLSENTPWQELAAAYINEKVETEKDALQGALDIIAEKIADKGENRKFGRSFMFDNGVIKTTKVKKAEEDSPYEMYYDYSEPIKKLPPHRTLAINRGEKEKFLKVTLETDKDRFFDKLWQKNLQDTPDVNKEVLQESLKDCINRLLLPAVERDIRKSLTETAHQGAYKIFTANLKSLLLQSPTKGATVLGVDPAYRTGCKLTVVDPTGKVLAIDKIFPTKPYMKIKESTKKVEQLLDKHPINVIAIGNGTASRETAEFIGEIVQKREGIAYTIVDEAGASVYSASPLAKEEFPDLDVAERSAISIARRLQDPLAELVKIAPESIGVGQYQHDMDQKELASLLGGVVEDSVNKVGADLNTASPSLLGYIAGIKKAQAKAIVKMREENGEFTNRNQIKKVPRLGDATFKQCAGFLRIKDGDNPLDNTSVHPESYAAAKKLMEKLGYSLEELAEKGSLSDINDRLKGIDTVELAGELEIGVPTFKDIVEALQKPGLDLREDLAKPLFLSGVMQIEDLEEGMIVKGVVRNVVDFGAFVDIGVKQAGLVHISEMAERYVKHPLEVVSVGDTVSAKIIGVDIKKGRIALSLKGVS